MGACECVGVCNSGNTVNALGFVKTASTETENGITYDVYTHSDANTDAKAALWVQQAVSGRLDKA
jgi:hypothetical protein